MRREDLEHIIRAAAEVADDDEVVVVGSQAIQGRRRTRAGLGFAEVAIRCGLVERAELLRGPETCRYRL